MKKKNQGINKNDFKQLTYYFRDWHDLVEPITQLRKYGAVYGVDYITQRNVLNEFAVYVLKNEADEDVVDLDEMAGMDSRLKQIGNRLFYKRLAKRV